MDEACEIDLEQLEQYHDGASNLSVADLRSKDSTLKFAPIVNPLDFFGGDIKHVCAGKSSIHVIIPAHHRIARTPRNNGKGAFSRQAPTYFLIPTELVRQCTVEGV